MFSNKFPQRLLYSIGQIIICIELWPAKDFGSYVTNERLADTMHANEDDRCRSIGRPISTDGSFGLEAS